MKESPIFIRMRGRWNIKNIIEVPRSPFAHCTKLDTVCEYFDAEASNPCQAKEGALKEGAR